MSNEIHVLKERADAARLLYKQNQLTREQAIEEIKPYIDAVNNKSKELAKKHKVKPKLVNILSYLR